jgi:hypothetical protein
LVAVTTLTLCCGTCRKHGAYDTHGAAF